MKGVGDLRTIDFRRHHLVAFAKIDGEMRKASMRPRIAFTLIELLAVIAIISLLVSVLLPTLASARHQAQVVVCAANLRQVGVAWTLYLQDSDEWFPGYLQHMWWFYGGKHPSIWNHSALTLPYRPLNPYLQLNLQGEPNAEIFRCTQDRQIGWAGGFESVTDGYSTYDYFGNCYTLNFLLLYNDDLDTPLVEVKQPFRLSGVQLNHALVMLAGDVQWYYSMNDSQWDAHFHNRHDQMNLLFLDGHVSYTQMVRGEAYTGSYSLFPRRDYLEGEEEE